jgi:dihydroflavonol-4-reductase
MIFVTGGTGLVGSHLLYSLTAEGKKVRALRRASSPVELVAKVFSYYTKNVEKQLSCIEWIEGDLVESSDIREFLDGVTQIYHCAAIVSFSTKDKHRMLRNNIDGTARIVNACLENKAIKLCFVSSVAALGSSSDGEMITEEQLWKPSKAHSVYSLSKFKSEMEVWRGISEGINAVIVNPSVIMGPGNWKKGSSSYFSTIYKGLRFYTNGITGYVDVRDVIQSMIQLMESNCSGERFIVNSENLSYKDVFSMIAIAFDKRPPALYASPLISKLAVMGAGIFSLLSGKSSQLTRSSMRTAYAASRYSNEKIRKQTGIQFLSISQSVRENAQLFINDRNN